MPWPASLEVVKMKSLPRDLPLSAPLKRLDVPLLATGYGLLLFVLFSASACFADELEPRRWSHLPINTNFFGGGYAYTEADISFDPVLKIEDGKMELHTWAAKYIRTFSLLDKMARIDILQAYQEGRWNGLVDGTPTTVKRSGWSDTFLRFAINLYGAPPLEGKEYAQYRATKEVETIVGAGLSVQLPTGDYLDDKLINLGTNRYTFRPQIGVVHTRGKWSTEATGYMTLYSDNNDFFNGKRLEQDPLYVINGHLVYTLRPGVWAGASAGYDYGGRSTVDGDSKDDRKQNLLWALSFGIPLSRQFSFKMAYIGIRTQEATGSDSDTFTIGVSAAW
jgi:hypothetical protein